MVVLVSDILTVIPSPANAGYRGCSLVRIQAIFTTGATVSRSKETASVHQQQEKIRELEGLG